MSTATAVKERPILFSGPMVNALLSGRKTQTRRAMKSQPQMIDHAGDPESDWYLEWCSPRTGCLVWEWQPGEPITSEMLGSCPYGKPGDRLHVKEALRGVIDTTIDPAETMPIAAYAADMTHIWTSDKFRVPWRWKRASLPSMFMPMELSRITLEITDVRVERADTISSEDALAEGIEDYAREHNLTGYWTTAFARLWDEINAKRGYPWAASPWCWVLQFKVIANQGG